MNDDANSSCISFLATGLSDWTVDSLRWDGDDLLIRFSPPSAGESPAREIRFIWAYRLSIQLDFVQYIGSPMLWKTTAEPSVDGALDVKLDFGGTPQGCIAFTCNDLCNNPRPE